VCADGISAARHAQLTQLTLPANVAFSFKSLLPRRTRRVINTRLQKRVSPLPPFYPLFFNSKSNARRGRESAREDEIRNFRGRRGRASLARYSVAPFSSAACSSVAMRDLEWIHVAGEAAARAHRARHAAREKGRGKVREGKKEREREGERERDLGQGRDLSWSLPRYKVVVEVFLYRAPLVCQYSVRSLSPPHSRERALASHPLASCHIPSSTERNIPPALPPHSRPRTRWYVRMPGRYNDWQRTVCRPSVMTRADDVPASLARNSFRPAGRLIKI